MITIRDADADDLPRITALYGREVLQGTASFELEAPLLAEMTARFEGVLDLGLPWLVAESDGAFAGYAYASPFRPRPAYRYSVEGSVYVEAGVRGRGVGRHLLEALVARLRSAGLRHLMGVISESDTSVASIALHRTLGFREVGVCRQVGWKHGRWLDVTLMQLDLAPDGGPPTAFQPAPVRA
jgi:L-amino acid N-acyltransferase YncA